MTMLFTLHSRVDLGPGGMRMGYKVLWDQAAKQTFGDKLGDNYGKDSRTYGASACRSP
jgi:hypothetical protein